MLVHIETDIDAPAETVWKILAHQFGDMADWTTTLSESRVIGASEIPSGIIPDPKAPVPARETTSSFAKAIEVITDYSEEGMQLTFEAANLPIMLSSAKNRQRVVQKGADKSTVVFDINLELRGIFKLIGPVLKRRFGSTMGRVQGELKAYVENNQ